MPGNLFVRAKISQNFFFFTDLLVCACAIFVAKAKFDINSNLPWMCQQCRDDIA